MRSQMREVVRQRFNNQCGYCGVSEDDVGARLTIDHFQPLSRGGMDEQTNLIYCCHACNDFKGAYWGTAPEQMLLHPLNDDLTLHIDENLRHHLISLTPRGRVYIQTLNLNRPELIQHRKKVYYQKLQLQVIAELYAEALLKIQEFEERIKNH